MLYSHTIKLVRFYQGVDGLKTGYTEGAGYCLTATANKNGMRLIAVVFGEPDATIRNNEISAMLDYGFNVYNLEKVLSTNSKIGKVEVIKGEKKSVNIVPAENIDILYQKSEGKKNITYKVHVDKVTAPIKHGQIIGKIDIIENNKVIRNVGVTINEDVDKANILQLYLRYIGDIIRGF